MRIDLGGAICALGILVWFFYMGFVGSAASLLIVLVLGLDVGVSFVLCGGVVLLAAFVVLLGGGYRYILSLVYLSVSFAVTGFLVLFIIISQGRAVFLAMSVNEFSSVDALMGVFFVVLLSVICFKLLIYVVNKLN